MTTHFSILGPIRAFHGPVPVTIGGPKQRVVLAALLLERGRFVSRQSLIDAVWEDDPPASAAAGIQVYVHGLRKVLGADRIETRGASYRVVLEAEELDAARFDALMAEAARSLAAGDAETAAEQAAIALNLWSGPALADVDGGSATRAAKATLEERRLEAVELHHDAALALGRHGALVPDLSALVAAHPYRERLREQLIRALYHSGRQEEALAAYRDARRVLVEQVGIEPGPRLRELETAILRQELEPAPTQPAARPAPPPAPTLPLPPTQLIGRDAQLAEIAAMFAEEGARLVTLTGPGGVGKTRLAVAVAERAAEPAVWVDLAPVGDAELVAEAIAEALGLEEHPGGPATAVTEHVTSRPVMLVLDNFERLLPAAGFVAGLLGRAPRLRLLVTSRAPLRVRAEHELAVPPLTGEAAVELFASRARAADRSFELSAQLAPWVASICRRLDGLPLAIELAAARLRELGPRQLDEALERRLELLVDGPVDLPERQQALRATLDWSHDELDERQRRDFAWLGVLAGSGSPDAAAALGATGSIPALTTASLLVALGDGRVGMLETVREYALEQLESAGETAAAHRAHARHFLELAEGARHSMLTGSEGEAVYAALDREHDNLRAALAWAAAAGEVEVEVRLACALRQFWLVRGHIAEGRRFFERAVSDASDPALRAQALMHGGPFAHRQGALEQARGWLEEALVLCRQVGDAEGVARCAGELGAVAFSTGALDAALTASLESADGFRRLGDDLRLAIVLSNLCEIEGARGNHEAAIAHGERAVQLQRSLDDREQLALTLHAFAGVHSAAGNADAARGLLLEALQHAREFGYREVVAAILADAAAFALADGEPERAARLLARGRAMREQIGVYFADIEHGLGQRRDRLLAELGPDRLERLEREARDAPLDELAEQAADTLSLYERSRHRSA